MQSAKPYEEEEPPPAYSASLPYVPTAAPIQQHQHAHNQVHAVYPDQQYQQNQGYGPSLVMNAMPAPYVQQIQSNAPRNDVPGIIQISYLPADACAECWACCACCWVLPQPQPESAKKYEIFVKGKSYGVLKQGQSLSFSLTPETHTVELHSKKNAVMGFISNLVGAESMESAVAIHVRSETTVKYKIGFTVPKCKGNKHFLFFEPDE